MKIQIIYYVVIVLLLLSSLSLFFMLQNIQQQKKVRIKKDRYSEVKDYVLNKLQHKHLDNLMKDSGLKITFTQYQATRYIIFIILVIITFASFTTNKGGDIPFKQLILIISLFFTTTPSEYIFNKIKSPFYLILSLLYKREISRFNEDLFNVLSQLKNLILAKRDESSRSDYVLIKMRKFTNKVGIIFDRMITLWDMDRREEAVAYFNQKIPSEMAKNISDLLMKVDYLKPFELRTQIEVLQHAYKKERETSQLKNKEFQSYLVYALVVASLFAVMLNFLNIVYIIDMIKQLKIVS
jgi:hypothetical protein